MLGTFTITAGDHDRNDIPVRYECRAVDLFGDSADYILTGSDHLMLHEVKGNKSKLPVQWEPESGFDWEKIDRKGALVWILDGKTPKGSTRTFELVLKKGPPDTCAFTVEDLDNRSLIIRKGSRPVLQYNYGIISEVEGQINPNDRSSYIHPLWSPSGEIITGDFSPEHIHQRGLFMAWVRVSFGEIETSFWGLGESTGRILKDDRDPEIIMGPVFSEIVVYNKGSVSGETYFKEITIARVYKQISDDRWVFDMSFRQIPTDPGNPLTLPVEKRVMELQQIYYGGMSFRGVSPGWLHLDFISSSSYGQLEKFPKDTRWLSSNDSLDILTSEGHNRRSGNETPARWIDYTGPLGDGWGGLVMFDNPTNQRYPTPLRIHPDMPYFCYAFVKDEPYTITSEEPLCLTYRIVVHDGHPDKESNEIIARDFTDPPGISWTPVR